MRLHSGCVSWSAPADAWRPLRRRAAGIGPGSFAARVNVLAQSAVSGGVLAKACWHVAVEFREDGDSRAPAEGPKSPAGAEGNARRYATHDSSCGGDAKAGRPAGLAVLQAAAGGAVGMRADSVSYGSFSCGGAVREGVHVWKTAERGEDAGERSLSMGSPKVAPA